jgi:plasmid maintenance system killer protein
VPGNRLEGLKGDRKGQYSIRINDRWRAKRVRKQKTDRQDAELLAIIDPYSDPFAISYLDGVPVFLIL